MEIIESEFPTRVERFEFLRDSGGPGRHRGGLDFVREYHIVQDEVRFSMRTDKHALAPPRHRRRPPRRRRGGGVRTEPEAGADDVRQGYVSAARAKSDYGIAVRSQGNEFGFDLDSARELRENRRCNSAHAHQYK